LVSHEQLAALCFVDYDRQMSLVAERRDERGHMQIVGMGQLTKLQGTNDGEFAILVNDQYQRTGLGTELLTRLLQSRARRGAGAHRRRNPARKRRHAPHLHQTRLLLQEDSGYECDFCGD
jgi:GNAT superfamily N-acetyltransferase